MNRKLKFRAWDKEEEYMHQNLEEADEGALFRQFDKATTLKEVFDNEDVVVMQYTGLEDKNGEEIYEKDIIKAEGIPVKVTDSGQDNWVEKVFEVPEYTYLGGAYGVCREVHNIDINDNSSSVEVIGNKFEDPNLL